MVADFVFNSFVTLIVVVDPLGLAPIFAALTQGYSEKRRREAAIRGTILGAVILFVFALVGDGLLGALSIGLPAFRTAGGILLFLLALDMIFGRPGGLRSRTVREQEEDEYNRDISVFPVAIPLLAGPGSITTVLLYTGGAGLSQIAVLLAVLLVVLLLTLLSLLLASRIMRLFGETGADVLSRVLGVLLAALAVQFAIDGIQSSFA
ncbi:MAG: MarC family protein [Actinomycetota bacterium]|nr:MarC family protein [Actinomycetota bacterium]